MVRQESTRPIDGNNKSTEPKPLRISTRSNLIGGVYNVATADVNFVFTIDGNVELVPAHKCVLALHSPVFRRMFYESDLKEKENVKLTDTRIDAFVDFMQCLYARMFIEGNDSNISPLLYLAHKYNVNWLEDRCKKIINEIVHGVEAVLWVLPLSEQYNYKELMVKCNKLIHLHGNWLIQSKGFVDCEKEAMKSILGVDFVGRNEVEVFTNCIKWAKRACDKVKLDPESSENLRSQLGENLELIQFESMTSPQFMKCLSINTKIFTPDEIQRFATNFIEKSTDMSPNEKPPQPNENVKIEYFDITSPFLTSDSPLPVLFTDSTSADVVFIFKNDQNKETGRIFAHKCILARQCAVFADQFKHNSSEASEAKEEVNIIGVSPNHFQTFLQLIYTYSYEQRKMIMQDIASENIHRILEFALEFKATGIITSFEFYLNEILTVQNVARHFDWARICSMDNLKFACIDLMKKKSAKVLSSKAITNVSHQTLKELLNLMNCKKANVVVTACMRWSKGYCRSNQLDWKNSKVLRKALGDVFDMMPFSALDSTKFIKLLSEYGDMFTGQEIKSICQNLT